MTYGGEQERTSFQTPQNTVSKAEAVNVHISIAFNLSESLEIQKLDLLLFQYFKKQCLHLLTPHLSVSVGFLFCQTLHISY